MSQLDDLAFFQVLARAGSLTGTARELGLSLSAVSKRLKQLEQRLGVTLASRTTRRLRLTGEGESYLARGRRILDDVRELEDSLGQASGALSGQLTVNATFGFGRHHIAPLLSVFAGRHPGLRLQLELTNFPLGLHDAEVDIGIRIGPPADSRLVARRLLANRRILCATPAYLAKAPPLTQPAELAHHACLVVRENDSDYALWRFRRGQEQQAIKVQGPFTSNDSEVIARLARDGHGIMLRSWWDVFGPLASGELVALLPEWHTSAADFYLVSRQRQPARVAACIAYLMAALPKRLPPLPD